MDPKKPQNPPLTPQDPTDQPAAAAPEPIAPFSFADESETPAAAPGSVIGATDTSSDAELKPPATSTEPVSIPIFDATATDTTSDSSPLESSATESSESAASTESSEPSVATDLSEITSKLDDTTETTELTSESEPSSVTPDVSISADDAPVATSSETSPSDSPLSPDATGGSAAYGAGSFDQSAPPLTPMPPVSDDKPGRGKKWIFILMAVVLVLAVGVAAAMLLLKKEDSKKASAPVKVGFLMALTGGSSSMGYGTNKGIQLAKKQLNADNIEIVQADSKCDPKVAAEAIKRLIAQKVVAIIGDGCSSATTAALPAANNAKIPMISPSASSPSLTIPNDYFFRVIPNDNFQGAFMAQSIFDKGLRKVAVFYTNESYGSSMSKVFKEKFESLGGKVITSVSAESDVIDLSSQMNALKAATPDAVFFSPNSVVSATAAIKVAREVGITAPFFGADAFYDTTIIKDAGPAAVGLTITSFPTGSKSFKQALLNEYQVTEQLYGSAQAYDAFHAIHLAVKAGATTGEQVAQRLPSIAFNGVSAKIAFDENGEISEKSYKYDLLQVKGGEFVTLE